MKKRLLYPAAASVVTLALHSGLAIPWGWSALIGFVGWPVIGTLITIDDDLPGGWSNPDGSTRPDWLQAPFWAQLFSGGAVAALVGAFDSGWGTSSGRVLALVCLAAVAVAGVLATRIRSQVQ